MKQLAELIYRLFFAWIFGKVLNFIGASVRWIYGSIWRTIFKQPKFTFEEYLYGPKKSDDWFDQKGHQLSNLIIAFGFLFTIVIILNKLGQLG